MPILNVVLLLAGYEKRIAEMRLQSKHAFRGESQQRIRLMHDGFSKGCRVTQWVIDVYEVFLTAGKALRRVVGEL